VSEALAIGSSAMVLRPKTMKLHEQLAEQLARDIVSGRLPSGSAVRPEPDLVEEYGVSKTVVRETLQLLASAGLLQIQHGKRTIVTPETEWYILNPLVQDAYRAEGLAGVMMEELYEVRLVLEPQAARWTAERGSAEHVDEIQTLVDSMARSIKDDDPAVFLEYDRRFHAAIIGSGASNRVLHAILRNIHSLISTSWSLTALTARQRRTVLQQHRAIAAAITARDGDAAEKAMRTHLVWAAEADRDTSWGSRRRSKAARHLT
jgi:DNA-binding FadR family transcriptional regulator